jgi:hypothetical protein
MNIKAENCGLDRPESSVYPPSSTVFLVFRPSSGNRPPGNLSFCCCAVDRSVKTQRYVNQSESGEASVTGSNSGGAGNALFFMR